MPLNICSSIAKATILASVLLVFWTPANADNFRCAGHIIEKGMDQSELLEHCGEPDARNTEFHNTWTYKAAAGHRDIVVYFYANGHIEQIRTEDP
jgi:hypothetical protein